MGQITDAMAAIDAATIARNEQQLAACFPPATLAMSNTTQAAVSPFVHWCQERGVRPAPALPTTVAAWIQWNADLGCAFEKMEETLAAIEILHNAFGAANPVQTAVVGNLLDTILKVDPPRSWKREEQHAWALLPPTIRSALARREADRDREVRRMQNLQTKEKRQSDSAETKPVIQEKEVISNG
jgi:hypothetical protein